MNDQLRKVIEDVFITLLIARLVRSVRRNACEPVLTLLNLHELIGLRPNLLRDHTLIEGVVEADNAIIWVESRALSWQGYPNLTSLV